jgi:hypothetical protein
MVVLVEKSVHFSILINSLNIRSTFLLGYKTDANLVDFTPFMEAQEL